MKPQPSESIPPLEYRGVRSTDQSISEIDGGRVMVIVPRQEIRGITLQYGTKAPHPILQVVVGLGFTAVGLVPALHLIQWLRYGGTFFEMEAWAIGAAVLGVWLTFGAFRRGHFLNVRTKDGSKRIAFSGEPDRHELEEFLKSVQDSYGCEINRDA